MPTMKEKEKETTTNIKEEKIITKLKKKRYEK